MRAVGGDEVDEQFGVPQVLHEVDPARVRRELAVAGHVVEFAARRVQGRNAGVAAARQVDGREVERQAKQVVAQRLGLELVDRVADLAGGAAHDGAGRLFCREGAALVERQRVEEGLDQADLARREIGVEPVDRIQQHRVAEAIDRMRELGHDRRIDRCIEAFRGKERVDHRLDFARELFEHEVLILHLGAELRRLEQALAIPLQGSDFRRRRRHGDHVDG